jgi:outer membrane protein, multidrug efflux system
MTKFLILLTLVLMTGCMKMQPPSRSNGDWQSPLSEGMVTASPACFTWWKSLNDPLLNDLMRRAALRNFGMLIARETKREDNCSVWMTLSAEVAKSYVELRGLQLRLELADKNITAQKETVELTKSLMSYGFVGIIDQVQAEEMLNQLAGQKSLVELSLRKTMHHLSLLVGRAPGDLCLEFSQLAELPALPCQMPIGCPCDFLARRLDVSCAGKNMASAGKGKASLAYYLYEKAAVEALEQAENSLTALYFSMENQQALKEAYEKGCQAYQQMVQLYGKGLKNYLEVLVVQQAHLSTEEAYVQSRIQLLNAYISLYQVLSIKKVTI